MKKNTSPSTLRRVLRYVRSHWALAAASLLLAAATVALTLYLPILSGRIIDLLLGPGQVNLSAIRPILVRMGLAVAFTALFQWLMSLCNNRITFLTVRDIRQDAFAHLQVLPLKYLDAHSSGEIVSRMIADVDQFADGLLMGFTQLFSGVLTILGTLLFMLSLSWQITLVVLFVTPLSLFVAAFIARKTYSMFQLQSATRGEQTALINEMITQEKVVQAFGYQQRAQQRFDEIKILRISNHSSC